MKLELQAAGDQRSSALVIISDNELLTQSVRSPEKSFWESWVEVLENQYSIYSLTEPLPEPSNVLQFARELSLYCDSRGLKRLTVLGIGGGVSLGLAFAVVAARTVRRVILVDGVMRNQPNFLLSKVNRVEEFLPFGFPFRSNFFGFDARPVLHRIHCPALVISTPNASDYTRLQADFMTSRIPNSWSVSLSSWCLDSRGFPTEEFKNLFLTFSQVPVKRPQKALA